MVGFIKPLANQEAFQYFKRMNHPKSTSTSVTLIDNSQARRWMHDLRAFHTSIYSVLSLLDVALDPATTSEEEVKKLKRIFERRVQEFEDLLQQVQLVETTENAIHSSTLSNKVNLPPSS